MLTSLAICYAVYPWFIARMRRLKMEQVIRAEAWEQLPHVKRLLDAVNERPAAQRAAALKDRYAFKTELDDEARRAMFPQNERLES